MILISLFAHDFAARLIRFAVPGILFLGLAACGGGGGGGGGGTPPPSVGTYTAFSNTTSTEETALIALSLDNAQNAVTQNAGTLDHDAGTISGGLLAGELDSGLTTIALSAGGTATLTNPANSQYMRFFTTSGAANDQFGVVGQPTLLADMPVGGSPTYNGTVRMNADTDDGPYALTGSAVITARFGSDQIDTRFQNLSGSLDGGSTTSISGSLSMLNATLAGTSFSGGTLDSTGSFFNTTGSVTTTLNGQFFGPNASEVGGTFTLVNSGLNISAVFGAD